MKLERKRPGYGIVVASVMTVMGAAVLNKYVLPGQPGLSLFWSIMAGSAATIILIRLGRDPF